jgi:hypothetical protein
MGGPVRSNSGAALLEKIDEQKVVSFAESKGFMVLKLNVLGRRGWPDRMFVYKGKVFFIEFKRAGETPAKLQQEIHARIRSHNVDVYVVDNWADGSDIIRNVAKECDDLSGVHEGRHLHGGQ